MLLLALLCTQQHITPSPQVTIIFVIDQLPYYQIQKLQSFFTSGLKQLLQNGRNFVNAHIPHGMPATCTGHTGLNTGAFAQDHGIVGNAWYTKDGTNIVCDDSNNPQSAVFADTDKTYTFGKSACNIMVEGISDQFALATTEQQPRYSYAISLKSRAAIATANKLGKAIWFDDKNNQFTSSKAYFDRLPSWLIAFNKKYMGKQIYDYVWKPNYLPTSYPGALTDSYKNTRIKHTLIDQPITTVKQFMLTPHANDLTFKCAQACLTDILQKEPHAHVLLWVCVSSLDKLGHHFGPESKDVIDMIYHVDHQVAEFMNITEKLIDKEKILYAVTADHGVAPIIEHLQKKGIDNAHRINACALIKKLNDNLEKKYKITNTIVGMKNHHVYLDHRQLTKLSHKKQQQVMNDLIFTLEEHDGIKKVWTQDELQQRYFNPWSTEGFLQRQLFDSRSGSLIMQTFPFTIITNHKQGTSHKTPYNHNTHVPLILYQKDVITNDGPITKRVSTLQLANTLAHLLGVAQPSASKQKILPTIVLEQQQPALNQPVAPPQESSTFSPDQDQQ